MKKLELQKVVLTTVLVALGIILDLIVSQIAFLKMPMGGNLLGISMVPLVLIGFIFGMKYGFLGGILYGLYSFSLDYFTYVSAFFHDEKIVKILALIFLDYLIPFTAFGLTGLFHKKNLSTINNIVLGTVFVSITRFISSTLSGVILWSSYIKEAAYGVEHGDTPNIATKIFSLVNNNIWLYSAFYNVIYILTTLIATLLILIMIRKRILVIMERYLCSVHQ
ncbi:MAG: energy-coupled thiamine transporter ThiT [Acholeplasma sp.]|nr:energy-coupled thiamine transporter ThiT [Acholeplasma sp.]